MDYSKQGQEHSRRGFPRHSEHNAKGTKKNPYNGQSDKVALLERMKRAVQNKTAQE